MKLLGSVITRSTHYSLTVWTVFGRALIKIKSDLIWLERNNNGLTTVEDIFDANNKLAWLIVTAKTNVGLSHYCFYHQRVGPSRFPLGGRSAGKKQVRDAQPLSPFFIAHAVITSLDMSIICRHSLYYRYSCFVIHMFVCPAVTCIVYPEMIDTNIPKKCPASLPLCVTCITCMCTYISVDMVHIIYVSYKNLYAESSFVRPSNLDCRYVSTRLQ